MLDLKHQDGTSMETARPGAAELTRIRPQAWRNANSARQARILIVAPQPFYQDRGTPIALRQVVAALASLGYGIDVLTYPIGTDPGIPKVKLIRTANPLGFREVPIGLSLRKLILDGPLVAALWRQLRSEGYACVHAVEEAVFPAIVLARSHGIPVLYDMQSSLPEQLLLSGGAWVRPLEGLLRACERWALERSDLVVCSTGLADRARALSRNSRVREWRFPSAEPHEEPLDFHELRRSLGISADARVVLYGGTFEDYQGLPELLDGFALVRAREPKAILLLVGAENGKAASIRARAASLIDQGAVRILDRQPRAAMARYLALAEVLVSPRAYGGNLPLKVFDYLAAGRPIVATDIPTHRTVLNEERAVLVSPDAPALAEGIVALLQDPGRALELSHAAQSYARRHLGWPGFVRSVEEIYQEVQRGVRAARR